MQLSGRVSYVGTTSLEVITDVYDDVDTVLSASFVMVAKGHDTTHPFASVPKLAHDSPHEKSGELAFSGMRICINMFRF